MRLEVISVTDGICYLWIRDSTGGRVWSTSISLKKHPCFFRPSSQSGISQGAGQALPDLSGPSSTCIYTRGAHRSRLWWTSVLLLVC